MNRFGDPGRLQPLKLHLTPRTAHAVDDILEALRLAELSAREALLRGFRMACDSVRIGESSDDVMRQRALSSRCRQYVRSYVAFVSASEQEALDATNALLPGRYSIIATQALRMPRLRFSRVSAGRSEDVVRIRTADEACADLSVIYFSITHRATDRIERLATLLSDRPDRPQSTDDPALFLLTRPRSR